MYSLSKPFAIPEHIEAIIFDMDGTLVDSMEIHFQAYQYAFAPWGITCSWDHFQKRAGIPASETFALILQDNGKEDMDIDLDEVGQRKSAYIQEHLHKATLIEPTAALMKQFANKLPMSIGTGTRREAADMIVTNLGIDAYIPHVVTADDVTQYKPAPETFLKCAELMGVAPEKCLVFEDGEMGIVAAQKAGMPVIDVKEYLVKE